MRNGAISKQAGRGWAETIFLSVTPSLMTTDHWWPATPVSSCWRLAAWNNGGNALAEPDSFLLPQSSNGVADGLSWVTFCPCMVYSKMLYWRNTFIVGTKMFSRWKLQIKTEQRKFSINPFEKNHEAGIGSFFEIKKKKIVTMGKVGLEAFWPNDKSKWSDNNRKVADEKQFSVFLPLSSGNANLTNF